jgi:hypothetical protein
MTPQPYPLSCAIQNKRYLVLGWTDDDLPIVVRDSWSARGEASKPEELTEPVRYFLPGMSVSVDGEISAMVAGDVSATVEGTKPAGRILVHGTND